MCFGGGNRTPVRKGDRQAGFEPTAPLRLPYKDKNSGYPLMEKWPVFLSLPQISARATVKVLWIRVRCIDLRITSAMLFTVNHKNYDY
jgi:hypothetical protein